MTIAEYWPILAGVAAFLGLSVFEKKKTTRPTKSATPWRFLNSAGVPESPTMTQGDGWYVDIPQLPGHLNYAQWFYEKRLTLGGTVRIRYRVTGGPILQVENDHLATAGLMVQRRGDNLTAKGKFAGYRWFSGLHLPLTEGDHEYTINLIDAEWGPTENVLGAASFADCLANADNLSIVFGGSGGRGHGVYGSGRFELLSLI